MRLRDNRVEELTNSLVNFAENAKTFNDNYFVLGKKSSMNGSTEWYKMNSAPANYMSDNARLRNMALPADTIADIVDRTGHCLNHPAIELLRLNSRTGTWKTMIPGGCPLCGDRRTPPPPSGRPRNSRSGATEKDIPTPSSAETATSSSSSRSGCAVMPKGLDANSKGSDWIKGTSGEETLDERWREAAAEPRIVVAADEGGYNNELWMSIDIPPSLSQKVAQLWNEYDWNADDKFSGDVFHKGLSSLSFNSISTETTLVETDSTTYSMGLSTQSMISSELSMGGDGGGIGGGFCRPRAPFPPPPQHLPSSLLNRNLNSIYRPPNNSGLGDDDNDISRWRRSMGPPPSLARHPSSNVPSYSNPTTRSPHPAAAVPFSMPSPRKSTPTRSMSQRKSSSIYSVSSSQVGGVRRYVAENTQPVISLESSMGSGGGGGSCQPCAPYPPPPQQLPTSLHRSSNSFSSKIPRIRWERTIDPSNKGSNDDQGDTVVCGYQYTNPVTNERGSYTGQLHPVSRLPHGCGTFRYADGSLGDGIWRHGKLLSCRNPLRRRSVESMDPDGGMESPDPDWRNASSPQLMGGRRRMSAVDPHPSVRPEDNKSF